MTATVVPFPARSRSDVFSPADLAAVRRWAVQAARYRCFLWQDEAGCGVDADDDGRESIAITYGAPQLEPMRFVTPCRGRWIVDDPLGVGIMGNYATLDEALQSIQPTTCQDEA